MSTEQKTQTAAAQAAADAGHDYSSIHIPVASSPHIATHDSVRGAMGDVLIALVPALGVATYFFGPRALTVTAVSVVSCVVFEYLYRLLMKKYQTVGDLSACVTGVLLAMCLPVTAPYWMVVIGAFFSIVVVKQLYGGLGKNFMNPALAGRVFLFSFPTLMNTWAAAGTDFWPKLWSAYDAVTAATPMADIHSALASGTPAEYSFTIQELLIGAHGGSLGEVPVAMLILGGVYLVLRKVITPRIPLWYLGTVAVLTFVFPMGNEPVQWMLYHLLSGGLMLGAIFMATDYVTSPVTPRGQVLYAIGCGALTVFLRYFGAYPEGVSFAILIMNALVWLLDKAGMPHRFGTPRFHRKGGAGK